MAIRLEVQPYCAQCFDFEPDVTKPEKDITRHYDPVKMDYVTETHISDTVVRCKYAKRCEGIKRYLSQLKEENA